MELGVNHGSRIERARLAGNARRGAGWWGRGRDERDWRDERDVELVCLVYLVCFVCLVTLVFSAIEPYEPNKPEKPNKPEEQEERTTAGKAKIGYLATGLRVDSMAVRIFSRDSTSNSCP